MPILAGQLINNGYDAENLDLNIKFFRTVLSEKYLLKTKKLLKSKKIKYDNGKADCFIKNISSIIEQYRKQPKDTAEFKQAENQIEEILEFVSLPYKNFELSIVKTYKGFEKFRYSFCNIKNITADREDNIFTGFFTSVLKKIKDKKADVIGITVPFIGAMIPALTLSRILKTETKAYILLGGSFLKPDDLKHHPEFFDIFCDAVLSGDGEEAVLKIAEALKNSEKPVNTAGLMYKDNNGNVILNEPEPVLKMNNIANMSYNGINFNEYMRENLSLDVMLSKGCYWGKCVFCSLAPKYKKYRIKTPQKAVSDLKELIKDSDKTFTVRFQDDSLHPLYLDRLADEIIKADIHINYFIFARFEKEFTKELFEKLYKSGLRSIFWGLESGSRTVLKKMNKGIELDNVFDILKNSYETGIYNLSGVIADFPGETLDEYSETLAFLEKIKKYTDFAPGDFTVMRGSMIEKNAENYGIKVSGAEEFSYHSIWRDLNISPAERHRRWNNFLNFFKNSSCEIDKTKDF